MLLVQAKATELRLGTFKGTDLATTVWAFATVNRPDEKLFMSLARAAEQLLSEFNAQCLANMAWVFAKAPRKVGPKKGLYKDRQKTLGGFWWYRWFWWFWWFSTSLALKFGFYEKFHRQNRLEIVEILRKPTKNSENLASPKEKLGKTSA